MLALASTKNVRELYDLLLYCHLLGGMEFIAFVLEFVAEAQNYAQQDERFSFSVPFE